MVPGALIFVYLGPFRGDAAAVQILTNRGRVDGQARKDHQPVASGTDGRGMNTKKAPVFIRGLVSILN